MHNKSAYQITALVMLWIVMSPLSARCEDGADDQQNVEFEFNVVDPIHLAQREPARPRIDLPPDDRQPPTLSLRQLAELPFPRSLFIPQRRIDRIDRRFARRPPRTSFRLATMPNMFGDFFGAELQFTDREFGLGVSADIPIGGGGRRVKIAENNRAMPTDRVFVMYHHFHNALQVDADPGVPVQLMQFPVEQVTIGFEKRILDGDWSIDLRMPFVSSFDFQNPAMGIKGGSVGNLSVALKRLLWSTEDAAVSAGVGINTPTGSDSVGSIASDVFRVRNESVHLLPFAGFQHTPSDVFFTQGFVQLDLAANGNSVELMDTATMSVPDTIGIYTEQNLLHVDCSAGWWLLGASHFTNVTGVAVLAELHYTTTLQDTDRVAGDLSLGSEAVFSNTLNRVDPFHFTLGLHTEVANDTTIRVGAVFPLNDVAERLFDSEVQVQINRRF